VDQEIRRIVKAADKLSAYIKCLEELKAGNTEFRLAAEQTRQALEASPLPEVGYFMEHFLPAFELTLDKPVNASQLELAFASCVMVPVREELYEAGMNSDRNETNYGSSWDKFASSGPFMVTGWTRDSEISMERNPNYPLQDGITLDRIVYKIVPESGTRLQLFESGQLDTVSLSEADLERYGEDPRILEVPSSASQASSPSRDWRRLASPWAGASPLKPSWKMGVETSMEISI